MNDAKKSGHAGLITVVFIAMLIATSYYVGHTRGERSVVVKDATKEGIKMCVIDANAQLKTEGYSLRLRLDVENGGVLLYKAR